MFRVHSFYGLMAAVLIAATIANLLVEGNTTTKLATTAKDTFIGGLNAIRIH